jgi:Transposase DDE domain
MPVHSHHTAVPQHSQPLALVEDDWATQVLPHLPADLATQARAHGAFVRRRGLASPTDLLRALLAFVLADHSTRSLGAWAVLLGLADLSEAAWRKRLRHSASWLGWLLSALLVASPASPPPTRRRVRLIDATRLNQVGRGGDAWRVHWDYDLTTGRLGQVVVTDRSGGEHLERFALAPDDIIVADSGYGYRRNLAHAHAAQAAVVLRCHPATCPLEDAQGRAFDVVSWLQQPGPATREWKGWCSWGGQRYQVRLVAAPLPPAQAQQARKRKQRKARKRGRRPAASTRVLAGWLLVLTTLSVEDWAAAEVLRLYRARWQVELVFKRFKQLLRVRALRCQCLEVAEATVRALLIAWVLQEQLASELREALGEELQCPVSSWRVCQLSLETLRQEVQGQWTRARLQACLPRLRRFLCSSPRRRTQQETQIRDWLQRRTQATWLATAA